jgi:hypothetical protein
MTAKDGFDDLDCLEVLRKHAGSGTLTESKRLVLEMRAERCLGELPEWVRSRYSHEDQLRIAFAVELLKLTQPSEQVTLADGRKVRVFVTGEVSRVDAI